MIYSEDIHFPFAGCPIQFTVDPSIRHYPVMGCYLPKIGYVTPVQVGLSESLYSSPVPLELVMLDAVTRAVITTVAFDKGALAPGGHKFAHLVLDARAILGGGNRIVVFHVTHGEDLLADSVPYQVGSVTDRDVVIDYTNRDNDYGTVFVRQRTFVSLNRILPSSVREGALVYDQPSDQTRLLLDISPGDRYTRFVATRSDGMSWVLDLGIVPVDTTVQLNVSDALVADGTYGVQVLISSSPTGPWTAILDSGEFDLEVVDRKVVTRTWFQLIAEGGMKPFDLDVRDEAEDFLTQEHNNTLIYSNPYTVERLTFGGPRGIPPWLYQRLGYVFACDQMTINQVPYRRANGAVVEKEQAGNSGLVFAMVNVQPDNDYGQQEKDLRNMP